MAGARVFALTTTKNETHENNRTIVYNNFLKILDITKQGKSNLLFGI